ncbi:hypothetical protein BKA70DRAFT_1213822 [Coprinopsis sp. MPI-PUGE-AT-0042]|nr:hypothetical protein BKA70DRAFT_1213822 [Coprinopsis sp. MPI-PUGE-AT-0042]
MSNMNAFARGATNSVKRIMRGHRLRASLDPPRRPIDSSETTSLVNEFSARQMSFIEVHCISLMLSSFDWTHESRDNATQSTAVSSSTKPVTLKPAIPSEELVPQHPAEMVNPAEFVLGYLRDFLSHGYALTGLMLNVLLLGIMVTQVYTYYTTYKKDAIWIRVLSLIQHFGDFEKLFTVDWLFATEPATTAIIASSVQLFFAWRVHILTQKWKHVSTVLVGLVTLTSLTSGVAGIITAWEICRYPNFDSAQKHRAGVCTWLAATVVCDALITMILVTALHKQKTGFKRTDLVVDRVIKLIMHTGLLTMVVAILDLAFLLISPSGLHLLFNYPLSKLYTTSMMSSLNFRRVNVDGSNVVTDEDENSYSTASKIGGLGGTMGFTSTFRRDNDIVNLVRSPRTEVFVQVEEHELADVKVDSMDEKETCKDIPAPFAEAAKKAVGSKVLTSAVDGLYNEKATGVTFVGRMFQTNPGMAWRMAEGLIVDASAKSRLYGASKDELGEH